jgi:hypothetical protein
MGIAATMRAAFLTIAAFVPLLVTSGSSRALAAGAPSLLPASVPPELAALEGKLDAIELTSIRLSLSTSVSIHGHGGGKNAAKLLSLFDTKAEAVETTEPRAGAIALTLFGTPLRLREVGASTYLYSYATGRHDGGRPWVRIEGGELGKLVGAGKGAGPPANAGQRFSALLTTINDGNDIRSLGARTLDGQAVVGFQEQPQRSSLTAGGEEGEAGPLGGFVASRGHARAKKKAKKRKPPTPHTTLEVFFAASGMPVRVALVSAIGDISENAVIEIPSINFPYTIAPPPAAQIIGERALALLRRHRRGTHKSKQ